MEPLFKHGDVVVLKNKRDQFGTVQGKPQTIASRHFYKVLFPSSPTPVTVAETDLAQIILGRSIEERLMDGEFGDQGTFARLLTYQRLQQPLQDTLYSLRATRTEFQPYQFKPLLKFLQSGKQRLLLADEVGLGKTIEAGFILCEMLARHPYTFRRALVVCKASLCIKWQMEMRKRFDLHFEIWKSEQLKDFLARYREDDGLELKAICSIESFRNPTVAEQWEAMPPPLDLMIIDEAHHLKNASTKAHMACREAAAYADAVLALTATPIQIGSKDLFNILQLLDEEEFASFHYFEACMLFNRYVVAAEQKVAQADPGRFRAVHKILMALGNEQGFASDDILGLTGLAATPLELIGPWVAVSKSFRQHPLYQETLRLLEEANPQSRRATVEIQRNLAEMNFLSRIFSRTRRKDVHAGAQRVAVVKRVDMTVEERGFYDSVLAYVRETYLKEGKYSALLFGLMMPQRQLASCIPAMVEYYEGEVGSAGGVDDETSDVEVEEWGKVEAPKPSARVEDLRRIIREWYRSGQPDSKFIVLKECLEELQSSQPGEPVVIFSYFKKTLEYLSRKLSVLGYSNTVISGSFTPIEREKRISEFRQGKHQILLSSEVGSEGLDFQFCHILVNYDLPWNPMVVEQRIGRLDRFGQLADKILIFNLSAPGTIEDEILTRLYARINLFQSYIGDLEAILGDEITALTKDLFDPKLSEEQRKERIEQAGSVLEKRKLQFEEWEQASPQFVGHDEYYRQEVDRAQHLGRFIRPIDLERFVRDFLAMLDKKASLSDEGEGVFRLDSSDKLLQFVIGQPEDKQKFEFCKGLQQGSMLLTFDSQLAEKDRSLAFLHVRHFFIRGIVEAYRIDEGAQSPIARIRLQTGGTMKSGSYLYLLARATIRAARDQDALIPVIVELDSAEPLDEDKSELCFGRMAHEGQAQAPVSISPESLRSAYAAAEAILVDRFYTRRARVERVNEAFVNARLASVRESYKLKIEKKQSLLDNAKAKSQPLSYIRMLEGTIRNLTAEQKTREADIEKGRSITAEHSVIAAGVLVADV